MSPRQIHILALCTAFALLLGMRKQNRSSHRRSVLVLGTILMFALPTVACVVEPIQSKPDPRLGREKRVIFSSGCTSSVTMPVGATDTLLMQPPEENKPLPADITPKSADPTIIEIANPSGTQFDMHALKKGQTDIEAWSAGARFDEVTFHVEPAKVVKFQSESAILAGGRTGLGITDIFGACGTEECPLFGHSFMQWSANPPTSLTFIEETKNLAHYTASTTPGTGAIIGKEPSEGGELVNQPVEIVDPATITSMSGTLRDTSATSDGQAPTPVALPASISKGAIFEVRVRGERAGKGSVAISWHDIEWTLPMGISNVGQSEPADPFAALFSASDMTGDFTLTAKVALLGGKEQQFVVTVKAP